jgi:GrpB-like predicted nucleotidyltransferase (UPF0157 family)
MGKPGRQRPRPPEASTVVSYDRTWPDQFEAIRRHIASVLDGTDAAVEHVGSTSVPGLVAKPIIDIDVVVASGGDVADAIDRLSCVGYIHRGDLGIAGREAFDVPIDAPYHHLYVVVRGSTPHLDHVLLRDYLRLHPDDADRYAARKLEVACLLARNRQAYMDAKAHIVEELLERARRELE